MNKPLLPTEPVEMQVPSAPPAYDDEFKPPPYNPPPYNPHMVEGQVQTAGPPGLNANPYPPQQVFAYPPPQPYPVMAQPIPGQQPQQVVVQTERVFVGALPVGPRPLTAKCPHCHADIKTSTKTTTDCSAHIICLLCFFCVCWCCSCIPYCMDSFHEVHHQCPNCKASLGSYRKR